MVSFGNNQRRKCSINTLEVLTLVMVIFTAPAYIDNHQNKRQLSSTAIEDSW